METTLGVKMKTIYLGILISAISVSALAQRENPSIFSCSKSQTSTPSPSDSKWDVESVSDAISIFVTFPADRKFTVKAADTMVNSHLGITLNGADTKRENGIITYTKMMKAGESLNFLLSDRSEIDFQVPGENTTVTCKVPGSKMVAAHSDALSKESESHNLVDRLLSKYHTPEKQLSAVQRVLKIDKKYPFLSAEERDQLQKTEIKLLDKVNNTATVTRTTSGRRS